MRNKCEFVSPFYYSNCLFEAIRAKIANPKIKLYFCKPYRKPTGAIGSLHVLWEDDNYSYDFSDGNWEDNGKFWQYFLYKGCIRRWPKDFARKFSSMRNRTAKKSWRKKK